MFVYLTNPGLCNTLIMWHKYVSLFSPIWFTDLKSVRSNKCAVAVDVCSIPRNVPDIGPGPSSGTSAIWPFFAYLAKLASGKIFGGISRFGGFGGF